MSTIDLHILEARPELDVPRRILVSTTDLDHVGWMWELHVLEQRVTELLRGSGEAVYTFDTREQQGRLVVAVSVWGSDELTAVAARCMSTVLGDFGHDVRGDLSDAPIEMSGEFARSDLQRAEVERAARAV